MVTGLILMWHGTIASVPAGWHICDGTGGTPDLRDRFIIAAKQDDAGVAKATIDGALAQSGGAASHTHNLVGGTKVINSTPGGDYASVFSSSYHYPPCYALAFVMKV